MKIIHVTPSRLITDPSLNPRFRKAKNPAREAREFYSSDEYCSLCRSFDKSGIVIPLFVEKRKTGGYYVREGFSRAHWAKARSKTDPSLKVPVIVLRNAKDARTAAVAMNTARVGYDPITWAGSMMTLIDEWGSVANAARAAGVSVRVIREATRLLKLPTALQRMVHEKRISATNALKITALPGWKEYRQMRDGETISASQKKVANTFKKRITNMVADLRKLDVVPDVGTAWNQTRKNASKSATDDIAVVLPTVDSVREACFMYGRRLARLYLAGTSTPKRRLYRSAIEHLSAAVGWCVPKRLVTVLKSSNGNPLYTPSVCAQLSREMCNEFVLAGVISIARREGRALPEDDELLTDAGWTAFIRQTVPLETLVHRLNRRLR